MRLLLDTHIVLWAVNQDPRLSPDISAAIEDLEHAVYFSYASVWEAGIKLAQGRLTLPGGSLDSVLDELQARSVELLPIQLDHLRLSATLPFHHGDPFDRLIARTSHHREPHHRQRRPKAPPLHPPGSPIIPFRRVSTFSSVLRQDYNLPLPRLSGSR